MAAPSITYTFSNATTADASQVNQNFTDLVNGASDGTKDYDINVLQTRGNTTLGNSSSDDITITASLAADLLIKTQYAYSIGSTTKGLKYGWFGSADAAAFGVRVSAPTLSASWNLVLPTTDGVNGQVLKTDGAGTATSWAYPFNRLSKTDSDTGYSLAADVTHVDWDLTSGVASMTIPAAGASNAGQTAWIRKTDSSFNALTLATGVSTTLNTAGECIQIQSDGSAWVIVQRVVPSVMVTWTPTSTQGFGTISSSFFYWCRVGDRLKVHFKFTAGTVTGSEARISFPDNMPVSDSTKLGAGDIILTGAWARASASTTTVKRGSVINVGGTAYFNFGQDDYTNSGSPLVASTGTGVFATGATYSFIAEVPITGWNG